MGCTISVPVSKTEKIEEILLQTQSLVNEVIEQNLDENSNDNNSVETNLKDLNSHRKILKSLSRDIQDSNDNINIIKNIINIYDEHIFNLIKDEETKLGQLIDNYILIIKYLKKRDKLEEKNNIIIKHNIIDSKKEKIKISLKLLNNRLNRVTNKVLRRKNKWDTKECLDYWFYQVEKKVDLFFETDEDEIIISMYSLILSKFISLLSNMYSILSFEEQIIFYNILVPTIYDRFIKEINKNVDIYHILYLEQLKLDIELVDQQIKNFINIIQKEI